MTTKGATMDRLAETRDLYMGPGRKYGSRMAAYLHRLSLEGSYEDESTGEVGWGHHVARFGRRLLVEDDRGFVWVDRFRTAGEAAGEFEAIAAEYGSWLEDDPDDHADLYGTGRDEDEGRDR